MRYGYYIKSSKEAFPFMQARLVNDVKEEISKLKRKGLKMCGCAKVRISDNDLDDFVKNMVTIIVSVDVYKAPRIVLKNKRFERNTIKKLIRFCK